MRASLNPQAAADLMQRIRDTRPPREGLHLSDLLQCSRKTWWKGTYGLGEEDDAFTLITSLGKSYHNLIEGAGEETFVIDGIHLTPDEITNIIPYHDIESLGRHNAVIVEYKTTRYSSKKTIEDMNNYVDQVGGYCALLGVNKARLHIFHLVGDYRNVQPVHRCYDLEFNDGELERWRRELNRRRVLIETAQSIDSIPLTEHVNWECKNCPLKDTHCPGGGGERLGAFPYMEVE